MQPVYYSFNNENKFIYTTKVIKPDSENFYQIISSNNFNLRLRESELKVLTSDLKDNKLYFGFIPNSIHKITADDIYKITDITEIDLSLGICIKKTHAFEIITDSYNIVFSMLESKDYISIYCPTLFLKQCS